MSVQNKLLVTVLKDIISELSEKDKTSATEAYQKMESIIKQYGNSGKLALALLGAELGSEE